MIIYQGFFWKAALRRRRRLNHAAIVVAFLTAGGSLSLAQGTTPPDSTTSNLAAAPNPQIQLNTPAPPPLTVTAPITLPNYKEATGPAVTIDQAVQAVIDHNTQVQISRLTLKRVKYQVQQITGEAYPQISISASDTYSGRDTSPGGVQQANNTVNSTGLSIPTITDDQAGSLTSSSTSQAESSSANTTNSTGTGSSTTASSVTIVPVAGSSQTTSSSTSGSSTADAEKADQSSTTTTTTTTTTNPILKNFSSAPYRINNYGGELNLSQVVDIDGLVSTSEKLLQNEAMFYDLDLTRQENELAYTTKSQYFAVLRAEQQYTTDLEQVSNYQAELTDAQNRYEAGTAPAFDVVSAQTELSSAQQTLIDSEISLDIQRATLNNLMNRPIDTPFTPVAPPDPALPTDETDASAVAEAFNRRPELLQADIALQIAKKIERLDHAGQLPQMAITAALAYDGYAQFPQGLGTTSSITAAVTLPLFDGGQTRALVNEAKTNVQIQQQTSQDLHDNVTLEVRSAFVNVRDGSALVAANIQAVAEGRESLRLANIRYKAGTGTLLEVTNADANLATAETNLATARFQLQTEYASLLRSEGLR